MTTEFSRDAHKKSRGSAKKEKATRIKKPEINHKGIGANYTNYSHKNKLYTTDGQISSDSLFRTLRKYFSLEPAKVISTKKPGHSDKLV